MNTFKIAVTRFLVGLVVGLAVGAYVMSLQAPKLELTVSSDDMPIDTIVDCYRGPGNRLGVSFEGMDYDASYCIVIPNESFDY